MEKRYIAVDREEMMGCLTEALGLLPEGHPAVAAVSQCQVLVFRGDHVDGHVPLTEEQRWQKLMNAKDALEAAVLKLKGH